VTDSAAPTASVATFVWPGNVPLFPQQAFAEDFNSLTLSASKWQTPGANLNCSNFVASSTSYTPCALLPYTITPQEGTGFARLSTQMADLGSGGPNSYAYIRSQDFAVTSGQTYTISYYTNGGGESSYARETIAVSFNSGATWSTPPYSNTTNPGYWQNFFAPFNSFTPIYTKVSASPSGFGSSGSWLSHTATVTAGSATMQIALVFDDDVWMYGPGPAFDNILIQ